MQVRPDTFTGDDETDKLYLYDIEILFVSSSYLYLYHTWIGFVLMLNCICM